MSSSRQRLGDAGERYAERRIVDAGMRVIDRKWRGESGEIDLIAEDGDLLVFVEVKTRRGESFGRAEETISRAKSQRLLRLGLEYIAQKPEFEDRFWRVDLIAITLNGSGGIERYTHIEDACVDE